jgi:Ca-activated chloride channel homolog
MTGRHRNAAATPAVLRIVAGATTAIVVLSLVVIGYRQFIGSDNVSGNCDDPLRLSIAAAPEMALPLQAAAADWVRSRPTQGDRCIAIDVASAESVDMVGSLAAKANVQLSGIGPGGGGPAKPPQVWIPDSSTWLQRLQRGGGNIVPTNAPSIARSPVVVGMPQPVAANLGWPNAKITWTDLFRKITTGTGLRTGIVEPTRDAAGLAGLVAISLAASSVGNNPQQATASALRGLVVGRSTVRDDLFQRFPHSPDPAAIAGGVAAAPLSEQSVNAYNSRSPAVPLTPVYVEPAPPALDYPYAVLPGTDADRTAIAERFRTVLSDVSFRDRLASQGLRGADGGTGKGFPASPGAPAVGGQGGAAPDLAIVDKLLTTWSAMSAPSRSLTVIDVSGSMNRPVPTANNASRMAVTLETAKRGLALFDDTWSSGLWIFSTEMDGPRDYREIQPIGPLTSQRDKLIAALDSIKATQDGNTGLYDTIFAGYKALQNGWQEGMVNTLIVMTDGENYDPLGGLTLDQLLAEIGKIKDPKRPVRVLLIGIGPEVVAGNLKPITDLTSGAVFSAPDPAKIGDIFLQAITTRAT